MRPRACAWRVSALRHPVSQAARLTPLPPRTTRILLETRADDGCTAGTSANPCRCTRRGSAAARRLRHGAGSRRRSRTPEGLGLGTHPSTPATRGVDFVAGAHGGGSLRNWTAFPSCHSVARANGVYIPNEGVAMTVSPVTCSLSAGSSFLEVALVSARRRDYISI